MRAFYSSVRLVLCCSLFMGGLAIQFLPSAATVERENRRREHLLQGRTAEQRAQAVRDMDKEDARSEAYLRLFGVLMGGFGLALALQETAYAIGRYARGQDDPLTPSADR